MSLGISIFLILKHTFIATLVREDCNNCFSTGRSSGSRIVLLAAPSHPT